MSTPIARVAEVQQDQSGVLMALSDRSNDRLGRLLKTYVLVSAAGRVLKGWWQRSKQARTYTVAVPGDDELFADVHRWLIAQIPPDRRRAELARTTRLGFAELVSPADSGSPRPTPQAIKLMYDGAQVQTVELDGHRVEVHVQRPGPEGTRDDRPPPSWIADLYRVVFTCQSTEARDAVERLLARLATAQQEEPRRTFVAGQWDWRRQPPQPRRRLESVVLATGQLERLVEDVTTFLGDEARYGNLGIPYHRGYLFEGPPGTGKTSTARVIADHLGLDVYYLPLPVVADDARLVQMLNEVGARSMLVIEDIDVVHAARERTDAQPGVSMSGLLNALDGFVTPHGLVTVMTTNHPDVLDDALIRPGRADVREHFGEADDEQLVRLLGTLLPGRALPFVCGRVAPASVIEVVKRNLRDPDRAWAEVLEALQESAIAT